MNLKEILKEDKFETNTLIPYKEYQVLINRRHYPLGFRDRNLKQFFIAKNDEIIYHNRISAYALFISQNSVIFEIDNTVYLYDFYSKKTTAIQDNNELSKILENDNYELIKAI